MKYDVIIIGGGLGGLECGYILSRSGKRVLLLERESHVGGCLYSYKRNGQSFDTGFHYVGGLGEGQVLHSIFDYLGLLKLPWRQLDTFFDKVSIGGRTFNFAQGYDAFVETMREYFPAEYDALRTYTTMLKDAERHCFDALIPRMEDDSYTLRMFKTGAYSWLTEHFKDPFLINVLSGTSLKMELQKETLPLFTFAHGNASFIESSWRLKGGGTLIAETLADGIRTNGGTILLRSEVEEMVETNGRLSAVRCRNGEVYEGESFISDVHPAVTCGWLRNCSRMRPVYRHRMEELKNTFGMFTVSLRLKPQKIRYLNYNHYIYKEPDVWTFYQRNRLVGGLLVSSRIPEDGSDYTNGIDLLTPMAWRQCKSWEHTVSGQRGETYEAMKRHYAEDCIALAEQVIPDLRTSVADYYTSTPLTYRDYTLTPEGSAYGIRKDIHYPLTTLLSTRTPVPNLFMTGQNLMLHGVQGVTVTALFTCINILDKETIWKIIKPASE